MCKKLKLLKWELRKFNYEKFDSLLSRVQQAKEELETVQRKMLSSLRDLAVKQKEKLHAYIAISKADESFIKQKKKQEKCSSL